MRTNNYVTLVFIILTQFVFGQTIQEKELQGKISADSTSVEGVNIVNSSSQKSCSSDKNGLFKLFAKEGDILIFSAVNLEILRKKITKQDLIPDVFSVRMSPKSNELKEVIINEHPEINAVSLGISPAGMKHYTPAERKIYTATSTNVDAIINYFSGRTKMLKKELGVEKKEELLAKIDVLFEDKYYIETLKIPSDYIKGFQYYCIEDPDFGASLRSKNKTMTMFLIVPLAEKFNRIIHNGK